MADAARVASSSQATTTAGSTQKERLDNQILHLLYVREVRRGSGSRICRAAAGSDSSLAFLPQEFDACVELIDKHFENNVVSEYPLYLKALIERQRGACGPLTAPLLLSWRVPSLTASPPLRAGNIHDSLLLFQEATALNPGNPENLKQVRWRACEGLRHVSRRVAASHRARTEIPGGALLLPPRQAQGRARRVRRGAANKCADTRPGLPFPPSFDGTVTLTSSRPRTRAGPDDWEIWHHKGLSFTYLKASPTGNILSPGRHLPAPLSASAAPIPPAPHLPPPLPPDRHPQQQQYNDAIACFRRANECQPHDTTFIQLGKVHVLMENLEAAIQARSARRFALLPALSSGGTPPHTARRDGWNEIAHGCFAGGGLWRRCTTRRWS